jgi:hypothetical protein
MNDWEDTDRRWEKDRLRKSNSNFSLLQGYSPEITALANAVLTKMTSRYPVGSQNLIRHQINGLGHMQQYVKACVKPPNWEVPLILRVNGISENESPRKETSNSEQLLGKQWSESHSDGKVIKCDLAETISRSSNCPGSWLPIDPATDNEENERRSQSAMTSSPRLRARMNG